jgi:8-oxo-dGTP pyrophosphatase MutT (NUDIX family)
MQQEYNEHLERKNNPRAGLIPYFIEPDGEIKYLFMFPSDPKFGGPFLQISKGMIDENETPEETAIRESIEEIGLREANLIDQHLLITDISVTRVEAYYFHVYYGQVLSKYDFTKPHFETKYTQWVTAKEFVEKGRRSHTKYVAVLDDLLKGKITQEDVELYI